MADGRPTLPTLPYLPPWYRLVTGPGKVVLEYGQRIVSLEGGAADRLLPAMLAVLDGTRTVEEIVLLLGEPVRPAVEKALGELAAHGVLVEGPPATAELPRPVAGTAELLASLRSRGGTLAETVAAIAGCAVAVAGEGAAGLEAARLLRASGAEVTHADSMSSGADLFVVAPAPAELPALREWNAQAIESRQPWLQVLPFDGRYGAVGPLYLPGDTACHECFRLRRAANLDAADELPLLEPSPASYPAAPPVDAVLGALAALLALAWLVLGDHYVPAAFVAFELLPMPSLSVHHVHRVPRCAVCSGTADVAPPLPWYKEVPVGHVR
jgi:bacteriocin biosynthesis cyclodehydratase domain-containing protein